MSNYAKMTVEEFKWEDKAMRPVMYCFRLSDYGKKTEAETFADWESMNHSYSKDRKWFKELYQYMIKVIDKCKDKGYNAFDEADIASYVPNRKEMK